MAVVDHGEGNVTRRGFQTEAIHGGAREAVEGMTPVTRGIELATTYRWPDPDAADDLRGAVEPHRFYRRHGNPNVESLEARVAALEGAPRSLCVGSGMAANTLALMAVAPEGGAVACQPTVYGEVSTFLKGVGARFGLSLRAAHGWDLPHFIEAMEGARALFLELPANPTLDVVDLAAVAREAQSRGVRVVVDATLATPFNLRPLEHGADVVTHSATKYLSGHSDAMGGVIAGDEATVAAAWHLARVMGPALSPFDAWLIERGLRTLGLRMERVNANAERVAAFLAGHAKVERVAYPTVEGHPSTPEARAPYRGFGGLMGVVPRGGVEGAKRFVRSLELFALATSLGGVESLAQFPASMARLTAEERSALGIPEAMVRLAVGCEDVDDLVEDLARALERV